MTLLQQESLETCEAALDLLPTLYTIIKIELTQATAVGKAFAGQCPWTKEKGETD